MTDTEMLNLIRADFKGVEKSVNVLSGKVAGMESTLQNVGITLGEHRAAIKETRETQLQCKAIGGWDVLNNEIKQVRQKQSDYRIHVESEMKDIREDATGQTDIVALPVVEKVQTNGVLVMGLLKTFGPWLVAGAILLGTYLGSGGDEKKTMRVLHSFIEQLEQNKPEPVYVPTPVSSEYLFSEEPLP